MRRLSVLLTVLGLALLAALAVPTAALGAPAHALADACNSSAYPPSPHATIMASTTTPQVGETIEASGTSYCPDEDVALTLDGSPVGTAHTDGQGSFDPPVVVNKAGSALQLCGIGASGLADDRDCITLSTAAGAVTPPNHGGSGGGTAFTGFDIAALCLLAAILLLGGGGLVVASRRKRLVGTQV
jgi:hypothetical protein